MRTIKVAAAGWSDFEMDMGDLVDEGVLKKDYSGTDITWTNISEDVIVDNGYDVIRPGESVTWEK